MSGGQPAPAVDQAELLLALGQYDREAWRAFFDANYQRVYRYAYWRLGHAADAEDAAAATFLAAARGIRRFKPRGVPVEGWLLRIAHHQTVNVLRKSGRNRTQPLDPGTGHEGSTAAADARVDLARALATLEPDSRAVIVLRLVEGKSIAEVASILGKSEGAVKMMQGRALRKLRTRLQETTEKAGR